MTVKRLNALPSIKSGDVITIQGSTYCVTSILQTFDYKDCIITMDIVLELIEPADDISLN